MGRGVDGANSALQNDVYPGLSLKLIPEVGRMFRGSSASCRPRNLSATLHHAVRKMLRNASTGALGAKGEGWWSNV